MTQANRQQREIDLGGVFRALEGPLGLIDSEERRADIRRYVEAARIHLERAMYDVLSDVVVVVNEAGGARARLEYEAGKLYVVVEAAPGAPDQDEPEEPEEPLFDIEGDMEKVTIRIPGELKELISQAANLRGVSVNAWYIRELARTISRQVRDQMREEMRSSRREGRRQGRSLRGFVGD